MFNGMETIVFIAATLIYFALNQYIYFIIDVEQMTFASFDYKPYTCRTCLTFWCGIWLSTAAALSGAWTFAITMFALSSMDAAAKIIDEKQKYGSNND